MPSVEILAWSVQHSSDEGPPARLQGNDIGDDRVMTFSEARDEVSRLVSPLPGDVGIGPKMLSTFSPGIASGIHIAMHGSS